MNWSCREFGELSSEDLYGILRLRAEVFVVEQDCVYQDPDGLDQQSLHVCGYENGALVCYARITPPGTRFPEPSIGRVVTRKSSRGGGLGVLLMREAIARGQALWPQASLTISAQQYLENFYGALGFTTVSEPYDEDGIPHIQMRLSPDQD